MVESDSLMSSLERFPPSLLSLITRLLPVSSITRLVKFSGSSVLRRQCCILGGLTELFVDEDIDLCLISLPGSSVLAGYQLLTSIQIDYLSFDRFSLANNGFIPNLPRSVTNLGLRANLAFDLLLRPIDDEHDPKSLQAICFLNNYVPVALNKYLPNLKTLDISANHDQTWPTSAVRYFMANLPTSLTSLHVIWGSAPSPSFADWRTGLFPASLFPGGLSHFATSDFLQDRPLDFYLRPYDDISGLIPMEVPEQAPAMAMNLVSLELRFVEGASLSLLRLCPQLQSLSIVISHPYAKTFPKCLPESLTSLTVEVNERRWKRPVTLRRAHPDPLDLSNFCAELPPIQTLSVTCWSMTEPPIALPTSVTKFKLDFRAYPLRLNFLPSLSLLSLHIAIIIASKSTISRLDMFPNLKTLECPHVMLINDSAPSPSLIWPFPPSLTSLTLPGSIPIRQLAVLPPTLHHLKAVAALSEEQAALFAPLKVWRYETMLPVVIGHFFAHLPPGSCNLRLGMNYPFMNAMRAAPELYQNVEEIDFSSIRLSISFSNSRRLLLPLLPSLKKLHIFETSQYFIEFPELPPNLETLEVAGIYPFVPAAEPDPPAPGSVSLLPTLKFPSTLRVLNIFSPSWGSNDMMPSIARLQALHTITLDQIPVSASKLFEVLPKSTTELSLGWANAEGAENWPPSICALLPQLRRFTLLEANVPLRSIRDLLPQLEKFSVRGEIVIHSELLPQFPENGVAVDTVVLWKHVITSILPPRLRSPNAEHHIWTRISVEWSDESLSKLPIGLTSLDLPFVHSGYFSDLVTPHAPRPTLKSLSSLSRFHSLQNIVVTLALPTGHQDNHKFLSDLLAALPRGLQTLILDLSPTEDALALTPEALSFLPSGLKRLTIIVGDTDEQVAARDEENEAYANRNLASGLPRELIFLSLNIRRFINTLAVLSALPKSLLHLEAHGEHLTSLDQYRDIQRFLSVTLPNLIHLIPISYDASQAVEKILPPRALDQGEDSE